GNHQILSRVAIRPQQEQPKRARQVVRKWTSVMGSVCLEPGEGIGLLISSYFESMLVLCAMALCPRLSRENLDLGRRFGVSWRIH
ncbi:MAG TPA: hypothetical protein VM260_24440, partial [Pirellula sp.]|nr:hypothetical protein [Pirellula sp.]